METSSGVQGRVEQLQELFMRYAEVNAAFMPPRHLRLETQNIVEWRNIKAGQGTEPDSVEIIMEEVQSIPPASKEDKIREMHTEIDINDIKFNLSYNAFDGLWTFAYYPAKELGIEVRGKNLESVLYKTIDLIRKRLAFQTGDLRACIQDLDKELIELLKGSDR